MRKSLFPVFVLFPILFFGRYAEAKEVDTESSREPEWTEWVRPGHDIGPWLSKLNEKIRQQSGYNELFSNWPKPLHARYVELRKINEPLDFEEVAYCFRVTDDGAFENLILKLGTGKAAVDNRVKELIYSAAPLKPPTNVPVNKKLGIMVVIKNDGHSLSISSFIPR